VQARSVAILLNGVGGLCDEPAAADDVRRRGERVSVGLNPVVSAAGFATFD